MHIRANPGVHGIERRKTYDSPAPRIPILEYFQDVVDFTGEAPGFLDIGIILNTRGLISLYFGGWSGFSPEIKIISRIGM